MSLPSKNKTWVIDTGDAVIQKKARCGLALLTPWEKLVYCLWVADYGMRNAGDLTTAMDLYSDFQSEARLIDAEMGLPATEAAFSATQAELERTYFDRFDLICNEIKRAEPGARG